MSRVNIALDDLDAGYKSGSCSDESSVDIEVEDTEPATRRSSSVVQDVQVTDVTPAPTRLAGAAGAAAAKAHQPTIARLFTSTTGSPHPSAAASEG